MSVLAGAVEAAVHVASSHSSGGSGGIFVLLVSGPVAAFAFYFAMFRYYRNTDKTNQFERETAVDADPIQGYDRKVDEVHGTPQRTIEHHNEGAFRVRVQRVPADPPPQSPPGAPPAQS